MDEKRSAPPGTALVATLTSPPSADGTELATLDPGVVGWLEVRADLVGELDPAWLRERFRGGLLYTLRSRDEGGACVDGGDARATRLVAAAQADWDLIDLEAARDARDDVLDAVVPRRRLFSHHRPAADVAELRRSFDRLTRHEARYYKLIPRVERPEEALATVALLHELRRSGRGDAVVFAAGETGLWTRPLAAVLGCPLIYGSLGEVPAAPGQPTVARLARDYGLPRVGRVERIYGIVGDPVGHSLSPRLHNGAYRALGIPALYLPFRATSFDDFWRDVVTADAFAPFGAPLAGLSVTAPHKAAALAVATTASARARRIGAANTLVRAGGGDDGWRAETTDPAGVVGALAAAGVDIAGRRAAVVGCGGAGRAAAYGLADAGAAVTLVNRGVERGRAAAAALDLPFVPLAELDPAGYGILIHATGLGHHPDDPLPFDVDALTPGATVLDLVYGTAPTPLLAAAADRGARVVDGREVLLFQALEQFRLMTGRPLDEVLARRLLGH